MFKAFAIMALCAAAPAFADIAVPPTHSTHCEVVLADKKGLPDLTLFNGKLAVGNFGGNTKILELNSVSVAPFANGKFLVCQTDKVGPANR